MPGPGREAPDGKWTGETNIGPINLDYGNGQWGGGMALGGSNVSYGNGGWSGTVEGNFLEQGLGETGLDTSGFEITDVSYNANEGWTGAFSNEFGTVNQDGKYSATVIPDDGDQSSTWDAAQETAANVQGTVSDWWTSIFGGEKPAEQPGQQAVVTEGTTPTDGEVPVPVRNKSMIDGPVVGAPVHETILLDAAAAAGLINLTDADKRDAGAYVRYGAIRQFILGEIWCDDPSFSLLTGATDRSERFAAINQMDRQGPDAVLRANRYRAEIDRMENLAEADGGNGVRGADKEILGRSHYGDLQLMHSMASQTVDSATKTVRPETTYETVRRIMAWARTLFDVTVSPSGPDLRIPEWFAEPGTANGRPLAEIFGTDDPEQLSQRAMGAMLHMVQDSYAGGHTLRDIDGKIVGFQDYTTQDHSYGGNEHRDFDRPALGAGNDAEAIRALPGYASQVKATAALLSLYGTPQWTWANVEKQLSDMFDLGFMVFEQATSRPDSTPGWHNVADSAEAERKINDMRLFLSFSRLGCEYVPDRITFETGPFSRNIAYEKSDYSGCP